MTLGVGVGLDAVSRQRYMNREMMARRAGRVQVRRHASEEDAAALEAVDWEPFDCFQLCVGCGYLAATADDPCPGCGGAAWTNLKRISAADEVRKMERRDRQSVPPFYQGMGLCLGLLLGGGEVLITHLYSPGALFPSVVIGVFLAIGGTWAFRRLLTWLLLRRRPGRPIRWRLPLPLPRPRTTPTRSVQGTPEPQQDLLQAPISGRQCLGYEITVLFDTPGDLRPPMWVLEEERTTHFLIGGEHAAPDGVTLELPAHTVASEETGFGDRQIAEFLRKRGLFPSEGEYVLFEALIEPGKHYRMDLFEGDVEAVPRIRPA